MSKRTEIIAGDIVEVILTDLCASNNAVAKALEALSVEEFDALADKLLGLANEVIKKALDDDR